MREIQFRGKLINGDEFIYGDLVQQSEQFFIVDHCVIDCINFSTDTDFIYSYEVSADTIGQYTGLKDKNGEEIYEGDIVKWGHTHESGFGYENEPRIAEVKVDPDIQFDCKNIKVPHVFHYGVFVYSDTETYLEIIGNIHETPDLLK